MEREKLQAAKGLVVAPGFAVKVASSPACAAQLCVLSPPPGLLWFSGELASPAPLVC